MQGIRPPDLLFPARSVDARVAKWRVYRTRRVAASAVHRTPDSAALHRITFAFCRKLASVMKARIAKSNVTLEPDERAHGVHFGRDARELLI